MTNRFLPAIENLERPAGDDDDDFVFGDKEFREWSNRVAFQLADKPAGVVIDILGPIGRNPFTGEGVDARYVSSVLKGVTGEVTVNINSPGGSYFEGLAIYSLLKAHPGKVTVNIIGTAASAAGLIAMGSDLIGISAAGSVMIHNASAMVEGDRHDLAQGSEALGDIDGALRTVYSARTGMAEAKLDKLMTPSIGTWFFGQDAVDNGFADELIATDKLIEDKSGKSPHKGRTARAQMDHLLAKSGLPRSARRELVRNAMAEAGFKVGDDVDKPVPYAEIAASIRNLSAL